MLRSLVSMFLVAIVMAGNASAQEPRNLKQPRLDPEMMRGSWPPNLAVVSVRVGRPTAKLAEVKRFYGEGLGLALLDEFHNADGSGVIFGLPNLAYHLEFTTGPNVGSAAAPTHDNNLVLYIPDASMITRIAQRLRSMGYKSVAAENPWWNEGGGITIPDPDGWNVILMPQIAPMMVKCCSR